MDARRHQVTGLAFGNTIMALGSVLETAIWGKIDHVQLTNWDLSFSVVDSKWF